MLDLSCCKPDVEYCLNAEVIDEDCRYCESTIGLPRGGKSVQGGSAAPVAPMKNPVERRDTGSPLIYPGTGRVQAVVPTSHAAHDHTTHDQSGTAKGTLRDIDVSALLSGHYIFSLGQKAKRLKATFVVQR